MHKSEIYCRYPGPLQNPARRHASRPACPPARLRPRRPSSSRPVIADVIVEISRLQSRGRRSPRARRTRALFSRRQGATRPPHARGRRRRDRVCGLLGNDAHAPMLEAALQDAGVSTAHSVRDAGVPSGQAFIFLEADGHNSIVLVGAANQRWPGDARWPGPKTDGLLCPGRGDAGAAVRDVLTRARALMLQREIPDRVNLEAALTARAAACPLPRRRRRRRARAGGPAAVRLRLPQRDRAGASCRGHADGHAGRGAPLRGRCSGPSAPRAGQDARRRRRGAAWAEDGRVIAQPCSVETVVDRRAGTSSRGLCVRIARGRFARGCQIPNSRAPTFEEAADGCGRRGRLGTHRRSKGRAAFDPPRRGDVWVPRRPAARAGVAVGDGGPARRGLRLDRGKFEIGRCGRRGGSAGRSRSRPSPSREVPQQGSTKREHTPTVTGSTEFLVGVLIAVCFFCIERVCRSPPSSARSRCRRRGDDSAPDHRAAEFRRPARGSARRRAASPVSARAGNPGPRGPAVQRSCPRAGGRVPETRRRRGERGVEPRSSAPHGYWRPAAVRPRRDGRFRGGSRPPSPRRARRPSAAAPSASRGAARRAWRVRPAARGPARAGWQSARARVVGEQKAQRRAARPQQVRRVRRMRRVLGCVGSVGPSDAEPAAPSDPASARRPPARPSPPRPPAPAPRDARRAALGSSRRAPSRCRRDPRAAAADRRASPLRASLLRAALGRPSVPPARRPLLLPSVVPEADLVHHAARRLVRGRGLARRAGKSPGRALWLSFGASVGGAGAVPAASATRLVVQSAPLTAAPQRA